MLTVYRIDRCENTSRSTDNEASLARSDSGTGVETHFKPGCHYLPLPPLASFFCFSSRLPPYAAFTYLFPCRTARMAVINRAGLAGIRGAQRATCCCLYISTGRGKKSFERPSRHPHLRPCFNPVVSYPFFRLLVGRLEPSPRRRPTLSRVWSLLLGV